MHPAAARIATLAGQLAAARRRRLLPPSRARQRPMTAWIDSQRPNKRLQGLGASPGVPPRRDSCMRTQRARRALCPPRRSNAACAAGLPSIPSFPPRLPALSQQADAMSRPLLACLLASLLLGSALAACEPPPCLGPGPVLPARSCGLPALPGVQGREPKPPASTRQRLNAPDPLAASLCRPPRLAPPAAGQRLRLCLCHRTGPGLRLRHRRCAGPGQGGRRLCKRW